VDDKELAMTLLESLPLRDQLKEMGVNVDDKELAMTLLASLPEKYKPLITALDVVGEAELSYEKVKNMILNDEDQASDTKLTKEHSEDAFSAQRGKFRNTKQRGNTDNRSKYFQGGNTENRSKFF
jgi:hypothetical protein